MGWTSYHATHYKNGKVDRKAECDAYFMEGSSAGFCRVVKSAVVGTVYYAAVENLKRYGKKQPDGTQPIEDIPEAERFVWAAVFLTSVDNKDYHNFSYKDMSEDMGPCECRCPESVLKLLSPTDSQWANEWRERCRENAKREKSPDALHNLPVGAVIRCRLHDGSETEFMKHPPAYQFKRPFWYNRENGTYIPSKRIPKNYEVVSR